MSSRPQRVRKQVVRFGFEDAKDEPVDADAEEQLAVVRTRAKKEPLADLDLQEAEYGAAAKRTTGRSRQAVKREPSVDLEDYLDDEDDYLEKGREAPKRGRRRPRVKTEQPAAAPKRQRKQAVKAQPIYVYSDGEGGAEGFSDDEYGGAPAHHATHDPIPEPGPRKTITLTNAKAKYKLTDKEVKTLSCTKEENPHHYAYAPMQIYKEHEVWELAVAKWGSAQGLKAAIEKSKQRGQMMVATKRANKQKAQEQEQRRAGLRPLLQNAGVCPSYMYSDAELSAYVATGGVATGDVEGIVARLQVEAAAMRAEEQARRANVRHRMTEMGLPDSGSSSAVFLTYIRYDNGLEEALDAHAADMDRRRVLAERRALLTARLLEHGLPPQGLTNPIFQDFLFNGLGLEDAMAQYAFSVAQERQKAQRQTLIRARMQAEGMPAHLDINTFTGFTNYVLGGDQGWLEEGMRQARAFMQHSWNNPNRIASYGGGGGEKKVKGDRQCSIAGCTLTHAHICTGKVCGKHKDQCGQKNCPKHSRMF